MAKPAVEELTLDGGLDHPIKLGLKFGRGFIIRVVLCRRWWARPFRQRQTNSEPDQNSGQTLVDHVV